MPLSSLTETAELDAAFVFERDGDIRCRFPLKERQRHQMRLSSIIKKAALDATFVSKRDGGIRCHFRF